MTIDSARLNKAAWAVFVIFVLNGFNFATWASRIPAVRDALDFSESRMGLLLLSMAVGSMLALPLSGTFMERLGPKNTIVVFGSVNTAGFIVAAFALSIESSLMLRVALFIIGVGNGVWDAAMNLEGATVEQQLKRTIMPRLHAGFSFGSIIGAGIGIVMAWLGVSVAVHATGAILISFSLVLWTVRFLLPDEFRPTSEPFPATGKRRRSAFGAWLEPRTLLIGVVVLAAALTEGAANDWVGLAVVDGFDERNAMGAVALTLFLIAMTGMRLWGTSLLDRYGRVFTLRLTGGLAFVGLAVFVFVPNVWIALLGVIVWGMGAALGFPVGMSAASDEPLRAAARVSVVATIGYSAFFMGPPLIGFLADHLGYRGALAVVLLPVAVSLLFAHVARPVDSEATVEP